MKNPFILLTLLLFGTYCSALGQNTSELEKRNGFKDIKLGTPADSIKGVEFKKDIKERSEFPAKLYTVEHADYQSIGEVKVDKIELKAYQGLIYEISVVAKKDPRLMKALESLYGQAEYDIKNELYFWKSESLLLKFKSASKNQIEMNYYSFPIQKMMKDDKNKKVDNIKNDF